MRLNFQQVVLAAIQCWKHKLTNILWETSYQPQKWKFATVFKFRIIITFPKIIALVRKCNPLLPVLERLIINVSGLGTTKATTTTRRRRRGLELSFLIVSLVWLFCFPTIGVDLFFFQNSSFCSTYYNVVFLTTIRK